MFAVKYLIPNEEEIDTINALLIAQLLDDYCAKRQIIY